MKKKQAVRNMLTGLLLVGIAVGMGFTAVWSIQIVMSLPR